MSADLDEAYVTWLYSQVGNVTERRRRLTYWSLLNELYRKEFVWLVPNDDNRMQDGLDLRREFAYAVGGVDQEWYGLGCSVLEMLIGLARRLSFEDGREPRVWFWRLIENLDLAHLTDARPRNVGVIHRTIDNLIWRRYASTGHGGLFPLENAYEDQRHIEISAQMNAYLLENL